MDLGIDQAGVIFDHADHLHLPRVARAVGLAALTVRPVARPVEFRQLERVDVQQRSGLGPLITTRALRTHGAALAAHAVAVEDLPDRRAMTPAKQLQLHRPVVRLLSRREDRLLSLAAERPRT